MGFEPTRLAATGFEPAVSAISPIQHKAPPSKHGAGQIYIRNLPEFTSALAIEPAFPWVLHLPAFALGLYFFYAGSPPRPVPTSSPVIIMVAHTGFEPMFPA